MEVLVEFSIADCGFETTTWKVVKVLRAKWEPGVGVI